MKVGQRIYHPALGDGVIKDIGQTGSRARAFIDFTYAKLWVFEDSFRAVLETPVEPDPTTCSTPSTVPVSPPPPHPVAAVIERLPQLAHESIPAEAPRTVNSERVPAEAPRTVNTEMSARRGIAALRLGLILEDQAHTLSVGTEEIEKLLDNALNRALSGTPTCVLVDGAWGGGKTHALTLLQAMARSKKMATANAVLDGVGQTMADPLGLMEALLASLRAPKEATCDGIGELLRGARAEVMIARVRSSGAHKLADALSKLPRELFDDPDGMQVIEDYFSLAVTTSQFKSKLFHLGFRTVMPESLRPTRLAERAEAVVRLLRNWSLLLSVSGARGLVVVLDELDVEYAATAFENATSRSAKMRRRWLMEELSQLSSRNAPLLVALASAPAGQDVGREDDAVEDVRNIFGKNLIHIRAPKLGEAELSLLLGRVVSLYEAAYPGQRIELTGSDTKILFQGLYARYRRNPTAVPRQFVRMVLEVCDLLTIGDVGFKDLVRLLQALD